MTEQSFKNMKRRKIKAMSQEKQAQLSLTTAAPAAPATTAPAAVQTPDTTAPADTKVEAKLEKVDDEAPADDLLVKILSTRRAHGTDGDRNFRLWLFNYLSNTLKVRPQIKVEGNILVELDPKSTVLFSCHVDTVHRNDESGPQQLAFDPAFRHLFLADKKTSSCLGGDDGVGVYIMLKMIEAGVKGRYMFHTGEERGGIGSNAFVRTNKDFCEQLELVVAFDRAVRSQTNPEVILSQGGKRCASDDFGNALCEQLNKHGDFDLPYVISHKGSFTDSKVYADDVPECVNVACFYERQHTCEEYVDVNGVEKLVAAACKVEWDMLPIRRNPHEKKFAAPNFGGSAYKGNGFNGDGFGFGGMDGIDDDEYPGFGRIKKPNGISSVPRPPAAKPAAKPAPAAVKLDIMDTFDNMTREELEAMAFDDPDSTLLALLDLIVRCKGLEAENKSMRKMIGIL